MAETTESNPRYLGNAGRRGEIILRTRGRRLVFIGGLAAWGIFAFLAMVLPT